MKSLNMTPSQKLIRRYQFEMHQRMIKRKSYWSFKFWNDTGKHLRNKYEVEIKTINHERTKTIQR